MSSTGPSLLCCFPILLAGGRGGSPPERCGGSQAPPAAVAAAAAGGFLSKYGAGIPPAPPPPPARRETQACNPAGVCGGEPLALGLATGASGGEGYLGADLDPHHALVLCLSFPRQWLRLTS